MTTSTTVVGLDVLGVDIELSAPFGIAGGRQDVARNVFVRVRLRDGSLGYGEAAPFPAVNGETREHALSALELARPEVLGSDARRLRALGARIEEPTRAAPSARAALECAVLDALGRHARLPLWAYFGGATSSLRTDITITTGTLAAAGEAARQAASDGFTTLKLKVGGVSFDADVARARAVLAAAPEACLILDGNEALSADETVALVDALGADRSRLVLVEQPVPADDLDGLRSVRERTTVPVAADESARSARDVGRLHRARAADVVNVKLTKSGLLESLDMIAAARALGLQLMIGGMVETRLCMSVSACLAAGQGGFSFVDLDTPLFLLDEPVSGGFTQRGPELELCAIDAGHGATPRWS
ncbi:MAG: dipeptide epimerase [Polyangiaceae bacterium]|nr:dipeptide epimerase [Polyangiaceae bacterium]